MKEIKLTKNKLNHKEWVKRAAKEEDCKLILDEPFKLIDEETGELVMIYFKLPQTPEITRVVKSLRAIKYSKETRTGGLKTNSRIFGYMPRIALREDYCRPTSLVTSNPHEHAIICNFVHTLSNYYKKCKPELYAKHEQMAKEKVHEDYLIGGSPFTSGIINNNNPLNYHFDTGNFPDVWSMMACFKDKCLGGHLAIPEYDLVVKIKDKFVLLFDGQGILHGVTPITLPNKESYRHTIVYYSLRQMWNCEPLSEELARIKDVKYGREKKRMEKMKE